MDSILRRERDDEDDVLDGAPAPRFPIMELGAPSPGAHTHTHTRKYIFKRNRRWTTQIAPIHYGTAPLVGKYKQNLFKEKSEKKG